MSIETILRDHFSRYPAMQIQDVYKLLHQAAMGSEHAISNEDSVRKRMGRELAEMGAGPEEPMIDPISNDGQMVRVHLRPFIEQGGNPDMLLDAFIRTANTFRGDAQVLENYWQAALETGHFPHAQMEAFFQSVQVQDYPAVHHSLEYEKLYRPAYRVVLKRFLA